MYAAVEFLVVDDNPGDIHLYQEFFKMNKFRNSVRYINSYSEMLDFLHRETPPDVIMMSVNMLLNTGLKSLSDIKNEPRFQNIPVVALTSSQEDQNLLQDAGAYISHFLTKPLNIDNLYSLLTRIENLGLVIGKQESADQPADAIF